jgi:hypothetical protein
MDEDPLWLDWTTAMLDVSSAIEASLPPALAEDDPVCVVDRILRYSSCSKTLRTMSVCFLRRALGLARRAVMAGR